MLTEVPVAYPLLAHRRRRFRVKDGAVEQVKAKLEELPESPLSLDQRIGACSASLLQDEAIVTTCAHDGDKWGVLLVTLMKGDERVVVELDIGIDFFARVQCFDYSSSKILLLCAEAKGRIFKVLLDRYSLEPASCQVIHLRNLLDEIEADYSGAEVLPTMVEFVSASAAIVALSPYLISVELGDEPGVFMWSEAEVKSRMSGGISAVFSRAGDMLMGKLNPGDVDMTAVSALTTTGINLMTTLHADGSLRLWSLDSNGRPVAVNSLLSTDLPDPATWVATTANSISLCSQLYGNRLNVAVSIETQYGCKLTNVQSSPEGSWQSAKQLKLPTGTNLVQAMSFSAPHTTCTLSVAVESESSGVQIIRYSAEGQSSLATDPQDLSKCATMDSTAATEELRLSLLSTVPEACSNENPFDFVDAVYLKQLFRPVYPRGNGTVVAPSSESIRNAIRKLVKGFMVEPGRSLEAETLRAVHEWRDEDVAREDTSSSNFTNAPQTESQPVSIYDMFASTVQRQFSMDIETKDKIVDLDPETQVENHEGRWRTLLRAVLDEESIGRQPLRLLALDNGMTILLRSHAVSVIRDEDFHIVLSRVHNRNLSLLEEKAVLAIEKVENHNYKQIQQMESQAIQSLASLSLSDQTYLNILTALGKWSVEVQSKNMLQRALGAVSNDQVIDWLSSTPRNAGTVVAELFAQASMTSENQKSFHNHIAGPQVRQAACSLVVRALDEIRRSCLSKCLVLFGLGSPLADYAARRYLHSLAMLWACTQRVKENSSSIRQSLDVSAPSPAKRLSYGDEHGSLVGVSDTTLALDLHIQHVSQRLGRSITDVDECVVALASGVLGSLARHPSVDPSTSKPYELLTELGVLPEPSLETIASDYPRLALRLMLPFVGIPENTEAENITLARNEALAECLLIESNENPEHAVRLREQASTLLGTAASHAVYDHDILQTAYNSLLAMGASLTPMIDNSVAEKTMAAEVQALLFKGATTTIKEQILRLCQRETMRSLFLPYFVGGQNNFLRQLGDLERESVLQLAKSFLEVSNILSRLDILERHASQSGDEGVLEFIRDGIDTVEQLLPPAIYSKMPEYISIWSVLFRIAEASQAWTAALEACQKNPVLERRANTFSRLVTSMVDAGALGELIDMSVTTTQSEVGVVDLDEVAAEALTSGVLGNHFSSASADAFGSLYVLQATKGKWKEAAQALELRCGDAASSLVSGEATDASKVADNLALCATTSGAVMSLVADPHKRFLISGEFGPYPNLPTLDATELAPKSILKRGRDKDSPLFNQDSSKAQEDRLSRFMTIRDIESRAFYYTGLRALIGDSKRPALSNVDFTGKLSAGACREMITKLVSSGYLNMGLLASRALQLSSSTESGNVLVGGRDLFYDSLSHIASSSLVPLSLQPSKREIPDRPSLGQLIAFLNEQSSAFGEYALPSWSKQWQQNLLVRSARSACAMEILSYMSRQYSSASTPVATDIGVAFAEQNPGALLPTWLHKQLIGYSAGANSGLFGSLGGKTWCDPSALVDIYMKSGMYTEACGVVSTVLKGNEEARRSAAPGRLPEKGGIDFVPYDKIDSVWNGAEYILQSGRLGKTDREKLTAARAEMERAVQFHFEMLKVSEAGVVSGRVLKM